jgi:hypothetical protein
MSLAISRRRRIADVVQAYTLDLYVYDGGILIQLSQFWILIILLAFV